jgi:hypothetical protein
MGLDVGVPAWLPWKSLFNLRAVGCMVGCAGKHAKAEEVHRKVLEARQRVLGPEHQDTLRSMNNLASVLQDQGKAGWAHEREAMSMLVSRGHHCSGSMLLLQGCVASTRSYMGLDVGVPAWLPWNSLFNLRAIGAWPRAPGHPDLHRTNCAASTRQGGLLMDHEHAALLTMLVLLQCRCNMSTPIDDVGCQFCCPWKQLIHCWQ